MAKPDKHVFVCVQNRPPDHPRSSCSHKGCAQVAEAFFNYMQEKQLFDRIQVTTTGCLGPCSEGPTVLVYPDAVMYRGVSQEDVTTIFEEHLLNDTPVERLRMPEEVWG